LIHLLSRLTDANGQILIPNFYDPVRPVTKEEEEMYLPIATALQNNPGSPLHGKSPEEIKTHLMGPLRQAFILFTHVSGYTAGFGRFWMSARRLEFVYSLRITGGYPKFSSFIGKTSESKVIPATGSKASGFSCFFFFFFFFFFGKTAPAYSRPGLPLSLSFFLFLVLFLF
jgi:hypothetical protein